MGTWEPSASVRNFNGRYRSSPGEVIQLKSKGRAQTECGRRSLRLAECLQAPATGQLQRSSGQKEVYCCADEIDAVFLFAESVYKRMFLDAMVFAYALKREDPFILVPTRICLVSFQAGLYWRHKDSPRANLSCLQYRRIMERIQDDALFPVPPLDGHGIAFSGTHKSCPFGLDCYRKH